MRRARSARRKSLHSYRSARRKSQRRYRAAGGAGSILPGAPSRKPSIESDPYRLPTLKNYNSLMPLVHEARKPIFLLRSAEGAIGGHANAVKTDYQDFKALARDIATRIGLNLTPDM